MPEFDTERRILDLPKALTPALLDRAVACFADRYPALSCEMLGHSMLDRPIHRLRLGHGSPAALYLGGQSGGDAASAAVMTRFINEYSEQLSRHCRLYGISIPYLAALRSIHAIPMLNPDGIAYAAQGISDDHLLYARVSTMNRGSDDLSGWQANARGVDLRCNYAADAKLFMRRKQTAAASGCAGGSAAGWCGEAAESEPESSALGRFLREERDIGLLIELRLGTKQILLPQQADRKTTSIGRTLGRLCGASTAATDGNTLCDWAHALGIPAFIVGLGEGETVFDLYAGVREMLFIAPTLVSR